MTVERAATFARWTFLIGPDGQVAYKNPTVRPAEDSRQVLEFITEREKK